VVGKFDAQVDTLVSLGEAAITAGPASTSTSSRAPDGAAARPAGRRQPAQLERPFPASHKAAPSGGGLRVEVAFTQEMEGEFRLDLTYEKILSESQSESQVES